MSQYMSSTIIKLYSSTSLVLNRFMVCVIVLLLPAMAGFFCGANQWAGTVSAQAVSIRNNANAPNASAMLDVDAANKGMLMPRVNLTGTADISTIASPAVSLLVYNKATAGISPDNVVPGYYYWNGTKWIAFNGQGSSTIAFSTGQVLYGGAMVSWSPVLMGFGNHITQTINGAGESTSPAEAGGFAFTVPFSGTIKNLQVSADALVASVSAINVVGLQYDFTVFVSPATFNNGIAYMSYPYQTTTLNTSVRFGFPFGIVNPGTFYSATNLNNGTLAVNAGDRIGIRIRTQQSTDPSANDITQLSFSATLMYTAAQ
jgi:hypothetical protein